MTTSRNKRDGMKPSELLAKARPLIASGHETFICWALQLAAEDGGYPENEGVFLLVKSHIMSLISPFHTYEDWLRKTQGTAISREDARQGRLAWIDDMTREFKKVGL